MFWLGVLIGLLAGWTVRAFADRQQTLHERRRLLTLLQLELAGHAERLEISQRARYAVPLPIVDWTWLRHHLPAHVDRGTLGQLAAYYAWLEAQWNRRFQDEGTMDGAAQELAADILERNRRLQERLEKELAAIREVRTLGVTFLQQRVPPAVPPAERLTPSGRA